ncbi:MAG: coproporphyrinogen dehydrogenase HemZ [Clostridia bacterium]|nr:coproporphyrinogen dehydrogenase HemZ [Clostridia bacterium]
MILYLSDNFFHYEAGNLFRLFFPYDELKETIDTNDVVEGEDYIKAIYGDDECSCEIFRKGEHHKKVMKITDLSDKEYNITNTIFLCFTEFCGYVPKWGMLTGIHPVKLYCGYVNKYGEEEAIRLFEEKYYVSEEKTEFCRKIGGVQNPIVEAVEENDFSLYISIPFCPTRCAYCSFVSQSIEKQKKLIEPYVEKLLEEIEYTAKVVKETGLRLISAYMGGGTPTTLNPDQLRRVIEKVYECFDMSSCHEFTVEAGRPDTIDKDKLDTLRSLGITRISVNPQTLQDNVLENIGRKHTAQDVVDAYNLARECGMDNINMDLIAGLQGDTYESFVDTLEKVFKLNPENITVHSLALKRSARIFHEQETQDYHNNRNLADDMIDYSVKRLTEEGYEPYYLYRQSRMVGNLENTGWAKPGTVCAYNIYTMDESQTVIACGAGGVTKLKDPYSDRLERIFNFKYSYDYLDRFDEVISRKDGIKELYEQFRQRIR